MLACKLVQHIAYILKYIYFHELICVNVLSGGGVGVVQPSRPLYGFEPTKSENTNPPTDVPRSNQSFWDIWIKGRMKSWKMAFFFRSLHHRIKNIFLYPLFLMTGSFDGLTKKTAFHVNAVVVSVEWVYVHLYFDLTVERSWGGQSARFVQGAATGDREGGNSLICFTMQYVFNMCLCLISNPVRGIRVVLQLLLR